VGVLVPFEKEVTVARRRSLCSQLYREARILGNVEALSRGPAAYAKRTVRRKVYSTSNSLTRNLLKSLGLSR
jgi:hypothetical protein